MAIEAVLQQVPCQVDASQPSVIPAEHRDELEPANLSFICSDAICWIPERSWISWISVRVWPTFLIGSTFRAVRVEAANQYSRSSRQARYAVCICCECNTGTATLPGSVTAATPTWSYLRDIDQNWGCGTSEKVVAVRGGQPFEIAGDLRSQAFHVSLAANDDVAFLGSGQKLRRITGKRMEEVADMPGEDPVIVAVDAGGAPLTSGYSGLLRWSPRGGWRRLLHVPPPPPAP